MPGAVIFFLVTAPLTLKRLVRTAGLKKSRYDEDEEIPMSYPTALLLLAFALSASATEIPKGAHLLLRMDNSINTRTAQEGDYVYLRTESPVVADGHVIVPNGSYVQGVVSRAKQSGRVKGAPNLASTSRLDAGLRQVVSHRAAAGLGRLRRDGAKGRQSRERHQAGRH